MLGNGIDDEDDHDPEMIWVETVDFALEKTLATSGMVMQGDAIVFDIEVINQGNFTGYDMVINDYIPSDLLYITPSIINDNVWSG